MTTFYLAEAEDWPFRTVWYDRFFTVLKYHPARTEDLGQADYIFLDADFALETNWPYYGAQTKAILKGDRFPTDEAILEYLFEHPASGYGKPLVLINMNPLAEWPAIVQALPDVLVVSHCHTTENYRAGIDISFPAMPLLDRQCYPTRNRSTLLSFRGANSHPVREQLLQLNQPPEIEIELIQQSYWGALNYADATQGLSAEQQIYTELMARSRFSAAPRGHDIFSYRLLEVMAAGAVPVVLADDWVLPFSELLDWSEFSLQVAEEQCLALPQMLQAISAEQWQAMQQRSQQVYQQYFYSLARQVNTLLLILDQRSGGNPRPAVEIEAVLLDRAQQYRLSGGLAAAKACLTTLPRSPACVLEQVRLALTEQQPATALALLESVMVPEVERAEYYNLLGVTQTQLGQWDAAIATYQQGLKQYPLNPKLSTNLCLALRQCDRLPEALEISTALLTEQPENIDRLQLQADTLNLAAAYDKALVLYQQVLALAPERANAQLAIAEILLRQGKAEGWDAYEARFAAEPSLAELAAYYPQPRWQGEELGSRSLLVWGEQGYGDQIQFSRYLWVLRDRYPEARIQFQTDAVLVPLFAEPLASLGIEVIVAQVTEQLFDFQVPLMSLPRLVWPSLQEIPYSAGWLPCPLPQPREKANRKFRVGIVWQAGQRAGVQKSATADRRSCSLETMLKVVQEVVQKSDLEIVSLQLGYEGMLPEGVEDWSNRLVDFAATTQVLMELDLLVTVDTAIIHLASATRFPSWLLLRKPTDWRWSLLRSSTLLHLSLN
ncbi:exostosin family protein [Synechococcus elongatus IITB4]|uniref:exostosin domain-containing protein n=1 Tax=Synechococcus elongatus TaxID=32046 RepID=UPI0030CAE5B7